MIAVKRISAFDPPLADTLRLMLPREPVMLLLRAATLEGDAARSAWSQWRQCTADPKAFLASDRIGIKRHLPLLYRNLVTHGVELGREIEPYFRAARAREEFRSARYRGLLGQVLSALRQDGVEFVVGKGVTIGETIHTDPVLRHSHDIDLLVRTGDLPAAAAALGRAHFLPSANRSSLHRQRFDHESGLPVELHDGLYRSPFYDGALAGPFARARDGEMVGLPVRLISDVDLLVHAPVHASLVQQRCGLSWIIDVITLLQRRGSESAQIDWPGVTRLACAAHAALPAYVMYQYLATAFGAPIPRGVIDELRCRAWKATPLAHLVALDGLRVDPQTRRLQLLVAASGWRSRAAMGRALLFPPPRYLRTCHAGIGALPLAMLYLVQPARFAARQLSRVRYRIQQRWFRLRARQLQPDVETGASGSVALSGEGLPLAEGRPT